MKRTTLAFVALILPTIVSAGEILKSPDAASEAHVERTPALSIETPRLPESQSALSPLLLQGGGISTLPRERATRLDGAWAEVGAAGAALEVAHQRLARGQVSQPDEREERAGAPGRLGDAQLARIAGLEADLSEAEARLQKAWQALREARQ